MKTLNSEPSKWASALMLSALMSIANAQSVSVPNSAATRAVSAPASSATGASIGVANAAAQAREGLRSQTRDWVAAQSGIDPELVTVGALDGRVDPPVCESGYRFDFPFESRSTVRVNCERPVRQYYLRVAVERPRHLVITVRALTPGEIVDSSDLTIREVGGSAGGFATPTLVVGRAVRRALAAGESPQAQDLEEVVEILRSSSELRSGQALSPSAFKIERVPRSRVPAGAISRSEDLSRARLRRDIAADRILTSDDLIDTRLVVVARRNLMRGDVIDSSALEVIEMDRRSAPPDHLASAQGLEQAEITGMVRAGEPLRASMVRPALLIRKGQTVILTVAKSGLEISVQVEALEDAKSGDQVKLRNPESGKSLAGIVTGRGAARAL